MSYIVRGFDKITEDYLSEVTIFTPQEIIESIVNESLDYGVIALSSEHITELIKADPQLYFDENQDYFLYC